MKQIEGFWLPDAEQHLIPYLESGPRDGAHPSYQLHKLLAAMEFVKAFGVAVDVGAHCGLWSLPLSKRFRIIHAYEPVEAYRECYELNLADTGGCIIALHAGALGDRDGTVSLHTGPNSTGDTYVKDGGEHSSRMVTLDSQNLAGIDFMKIDCEGFEYFVLKGGELTIRRDQPCIIVEQKPGKAKQYNLGDTDAVKLLKSWGAVMRKEISGDFICSWD